MTIEEAMKRCNKNKKVLVAIQDLEDENVDMELLWEDDGISDEPFIITDHY